MKYYFYLRRDSARPVISRAQNPRITAVFGLGTTGRHETAANIFLLKFYLFAGILRREVRDRYHLRGGAILRLYLELGIVVTRLSLCPA